MGLIDLNTTEDDEAPLSASSSSAASSSSSHSGISTSASTLVGPPPPPPPPPSSVCLELWHACAGPLISLPKKGSVVVYLPQGHFEHVQDFPVTAYDIPPHVFCRVLDVKLHVSVCFGSSLFYPSSDKTKPMCRLRSFCSFFPFLEFGFFMGVSICVSVCLLADKVDVFPCLVQRFTNEGATPLVFSLVLVPLDESSEKGKYGVVCFLFYTYFNEIWCFFLGRQRKGAMKYIAKCCWFLKVR